MHENIIIKSLSLLRLRADFFTGLVCEHIALSLSSALIAFVIGLFLAIFISEYQRYAKIILGAVNFIYIIPSISLLGLFIPFFGIGNLSAIIALSLYALLPMVRNSYTALISVDKELVDSALSMGAKRWQVLCYVKLPMAFAAIIASFRNMLIMTVALAGIAAFIGAGGLGVAIYRGITTNNQALILAGSMLMIVLALALDGVLAIIQRLASLKRFNRWFWGLIATIFFAVLAANIAFSSKTTAITIASKPMSEQYILAEMLKILIEGDLNISVSLVQGVGGGTANIDIGMQNGVFDLYTEYTGTAFSSVASGDGVYSEERFGELESFYKRRGMSLLAPLGFNNTFGIALNRLIADKYGIKTFSDLARHSALLSFGAEYDFYDRPDGLKGLQNAYNMSFAKTFDMDIGLKYGALLSGKIDAINVFTTDARLDDERILVLDDDRGFYPSYRAILVVRDEVLDKFPALKSTLLKLENMISDKEMSALNRALEIDKREPRDIAKEFLYKKGLI